MLHSRISANCIDRIMQCPNSIDFGKGELQPAGSYYLNSQQNRASVRGQVIDELAKNKFYKALYGDDHDRLKKLITTKWKLPKTINGITYSWGDRDSEYQVLGDKASAFMLEKLDACSEKYAEHYVSMLSLFEDFPNVEFYTNPKGVYVAYNRVTNTEFDFGVNPDFSGICEDVAFVLELKTGTAYGKNLETQIKVSALGFALEYPEVKRVIGGCYNVDTEHYDEWVYSRQDLLDFLPTLKSILLSVYNDVQPEYLVGVRDVKTIDWCSNCACKRCPYSRVNKDNPDFVKSYQEYVMQSLKSDCSEEVWQMLVMVNPWVKNVEV